MLFAAFGGIASAAFAVVFLWVRDEHSARILPHFGVACGAADRTAMTAAARYDAKTPGFEFEPDSGAKQRGATPIARAAAERWLGDLYRRLEVLRAAG